MRKSVLRSCVSAAALAVVAVSAAPAFAADEQDASAGGDDAASTDTLGEIVVTAVKGGQSKLNTSVSISSLSAEAIDNLNVSSDLELMRAIPGIQVPGTGGPGGNGNISIRGLRTPSGGSPFLQLQEDGLPLVLNGDMAFANNDFFTKTGPIVDRVEAIRGGSASTLASQAVGGVVNFISRTGRGDGGFIEIEKGLDYDFTKVLGVVSGSINDTTYFNVGGYFGIGKGPRHASFNVSDSYEIKGNITKEFGDGGRDFIRVYFKAADTKEPFYNSGLALLTLSGNTVTSLSPSSGYDYRRQAGTYSIYNREWTIVDYDGSNATNAATRTVRNNGVETRQRMVQLQAHYNISDNVTIDNNGRISRMSGSFAAGFYGAAATSSLIGGGIGSFIYANGPRAGQLFTGSVVNNGVNIYTRMRNLDSVANDLSLGAKFEGGGNSTFNFHAGWFYMNQKVAMDWHPNSTFADGTVGENPAMLTPVSGANGAGALLAINGTAGYNNAWGNGGCCAQSYDLEYTINAPYANAIIEMGDFSLDGSIRQELYDYSGTQMAGTGTAASLGTITATQIDPRTNLPVSTSLPYAFANVTSRFDFDASATNWSVGLLYKFSPNTTAFVRAAHGVRFNADRLAWAGTSNADGSLNGSGLASLRFPVDQYEIGLKSRGTLLGGRYTLEATLYKTKYSISSFGVGSNCLVINPAATNTTTCILDTSFRNTGYEVFATYSSGGFSLMANLSGDFSKFRPAGATVDQNSPLAHLAYTMQASYSPAEGSALGIGVTGNTKTTVPGGLTYPGSAVFTAFGKIGITENLSAEVSVYNLFNSFALQGNQPGIAFGSFSSAPVVDGRSVKASIRFSF